MRCNSFRIGGPLVLAAVVAGAPALAQQSPAPVPVPSPTPSQTPSVFYLPGVTPERYSIGPTATPAPTPTATPVPQVRPARVELQPTPRAAPTPIASPRPVPAPTASATPISDVAPVPQVVATPEPVATQAPVTAEVPAAAGDWLPGWAWALLGAGATALAMGGWWALQRRRRPEDSVPDVVPPQVADPVPPPLPPVALPPVRGNAVPVPAPAEPFEIALSNIRVSFGAQDIALDLELLVGNLQPGNADAIRAALVLLSANPDQDQQRAAFHGATMLEQAGAPFDLPPGKGARIPVRLAIPRDAVHVVDVGGRPMFVPMLLVDLRWRAGLSVRRFAADFMLGTAGQGGKLGPIWLDRPAPAATLAATRYQPRAAVPA
ncbi:hypothetical protein ACG3SL_11495 [Sphingomonas sp. CJ20]